MSIITRRAILCFLVVMLGWTGCLTIDSSESTSTDVATIPTINEEVTDFGVPYYEILLNHFSAEFYYKELTTKEQIAAEQTSIKAYILHIYDVLETEIKEEDYNLAKEMVAEEERRVILLYNRYAEVYQAIIAREEEQAKWEARMAEYPVATIVWKHLTENMGYTDQAAAGVIGNMMAECGGQSLRLNWQSDNGTGHYGLCQWSDSFGLKGSSLEQQLEFMIYSFPEQINKWGPRLYRDGFTHDEFRSMTDAEEAARVFCLVYERPGNKNYEKRASNALKAYNYFTS